MSRDYAQISRDFMRALRGRRSQAAFSRRLGYRTNVAYTWESGRAFPTAATVLSAAARSGIDVRAALTRFYRSSPPWLSEADPTSPLGVARLLDDLRGRTSVVELASASKRSRFAIARWLKGDAEPRLPEFFLLLETTSLRLLDFISMFTDVAKLPSLAVAWAELEATRRAAYDVPWTQAVLRALELTEYKSLPKHERGWLARRVGISLEEEQRCLKLLARTGQIRLLRGRWELREVLAVDTRRDAESELAVRAWWLEAALARLRAGDSGIFSYNVFAVSEADFQRINDLYRAYFRQVRSIIGQSAPSERVVLFCLQLLPLDRHAQETP
jgi:transcriptional regulator with XRE-family HTH domain